MRLLEEFRKIIVIFRLQNAFLLAMSYQLLFFALSSLESAQGGKYEYNRWRVILR
jgi:hypothetical protein